mmetsp:Transcript_8107/g.14211  ORF Transcript_8107/g.14211 Transcript_8107/m.14211 type:complete len:279 (+) Transcript_8107:342-1178(+)|eukprot:CAMPEP_0183729010 /NCGR_PEP_ID=MMETSP0737-20130205/29477_1 /TAXON_ID=385413 /ORGANISM="Thalassiosira miniscula, Strain CCMP1093" /LENGTH=278 /DNA_ID=CAMNT_0025961095 /DNA_START=314 /DNA_END=1150 /DNA_ORIENTATION=+
MVAKLNHYEVLEISEDAKLIDIKKAYRRLALKHHPDRNGGSAESTEKFKEISTAYTILSDTAKRREYDVTKNTKFSSTSASNTPSKTQPSTTATSSAASAASSSASSTSSGKDAFKQFNDLFRNDPFFHDAFQDMDDIFAQKFDNSDEFRDDMNTSEDDGKCDGVAPFFFCGAMEPPKIQKQKANNVPWSQWLMNKLGIEVSVTSISEKADGSVEASTYTSKNSCKKKKRTYVENGKEVSVMTMEKDGNKIEDKFIGGKMVERRVNGKVEELQKKVTA